MELIIGIILGFLLGFTGAGGSVFTVPLLVVLMGMPVNIAMGTALGAVALSAMYGVSSQYRNIEWSQGLLLGCIGMLTAPLGRWMSANIAELWLLIGFSALAIAIAVVMWRHAGARPRLVGPPEPDVNRDICCELGISGVARQLQTKRWVTVSGGLGIGFLSGLFGVGGGIFIVPFLNCVVGLSITAAVATSLFVIALVSSVGFLSHLALFPNFDFLIMLKIVIAGIAGLILGQRFALRVNGNQQQKFVAVLLSLISSFALFERI